MLITIKTTDLYHCLDIVEKILPSRTTLPVIKNIFLKITGKKMLFFTTNQEMNVSVSIDYESEETGSFLISPKIVDIIRHFPTNEVTLDLSLENKRLEIYGGKAHFKLYISDSTEYPYTDFVNHNDMVYLDIEMSALKNAIKSVLFAASNEETRPAFNGVLFSFQNQFISLTASDTYRLAIKQVSNEEWSFSENKYLLPAKALRELLRILSDTDQSVRIFNHNKYLVFSFDNVVFASRLLGEKYPDVGAVIPENYKTRIEIDKKKLEHALIRAALLAEGKNLSVKINIKDSTLEASVSAQEGSMEELIAVEQQGDDVNLSVNSRYLIEVLKIIEDNAILVDFHGEGGPLIFRHIDDDSYIYLVLPIKKII